MGRGHPGTELVQKPEITVDSLAFSGASLKLSVGMTNPNAFAMHMDGLEYAPRPGDTEKVPFDCDGRVSFVG